MPLRTLISGACEAAPTPVRLGRVLRRLGIARSTWYRHPAETPQKPGRQGKPVSEALAEPSRQFAERSPWWGYKRIAVVARRAGVAVSNKQVYRVMKAAGLLQKRRVRDAAIYQAARLFELLPQCPNELWQAEVTDLHIPGHGWW